MIRVSVGRQSKVGRDKKKRREMMINLCVYLTQFAYRVVNGFIFQSEDINLFLFRFQSTLSRELKSRENDFGREKKTGGGRETRNLI